jgi:hypothetical protein
MVMDAIDLQPPGYPSPSTQLGEKIDELGTCSDPLPPLHAFLSKVWFKLLGMNNIRQVMRVAIPKQFVQNKSFSTFYVRGVSAFGPLKMPSSGPASCNQGKS